MNATNRRALYRALDRALIGALFVLAVLMVAVQVARATEIIPSVGMTRAIDGDDQSKISGGLALRTDLAPMLKTELGVSYRSDDYFNGDLKVRQWPVTASLWLSPVSSIYAGAGVGWYQTTLDYAPSTGLSNSTEQKFGVHVGGGLQIPLSPSAAVDLGGRYIFMRDQQSRLVPEKFNPDFWNTTIGLAIKF